MVSDAYSSYTSSVFISFVYWEAGGILSQSLTERGTSRYSLANENKPSLMCKHFPSNKPSGCYRSLDFSLLLGY